MDDRPLTEDERLRALKYVAGQQKFNRLAFFSPYPKQMEFLSAGKRCRERLLCAGNRVGKSHVGAFEAAVHATGQYPRWWRGFRFDQPTQGWACGVTAEATRNIVQSKLCGPYGVDQDYGSGMIPKECLIDRSFARGVTDAIDTIQVRHVTGGVSTIGFKSYEQGRRKFQGAGLNWIWFDEEPDMDIYAEGLTRIGEQGGRAFMTFTPMEGPTKIVARFRDEPAPARAIILMNLWDDVPVKDKGGHLTDEQKKEMEEGYPKHQRRARVMGVPFLGSGLIFTAPEELITEPPLTYIPDYWPRLWGIDPGIDHPFGAALIIWDRDNDIVHVHHAIRMSDARPQDHAYAMKKIGANVPVAFPKDATDRERGTGQPLAALYKEHGLVMLAQHATWNDGSVSTEAGIMEMDERMKTGRFKVAAQLNEWFEEYRLYHRKDGKIVKVKDDLLSATRVAIMMKRYARVVPLGAVAGRPVNEQRMAKGIDFDLFATGDTY